ncbi:hypothetical protein [Halorubrum lacusprofundi]|uniref:Uncharacterized protein n=1 Tax=Halorubrum lacusprofundi (strain ATCC 49239 / DSM 5036 / JCM 8891 / ACAM 34) TaxID=416348 RepID=B9LUL5_HALLT|nr:hypothetical protein [Halorubrum lacusprofundi]ACM56372.1 hypothetical protein Hlac_0772 [Halorubrum lacusprofundi ATCC 49239]
MTATIYKIPIPEATVPTEQDALGTQLSEQGVLGSDAIVEALSSQAADLTLTGRYAYGSYYSELLANELEELADSSVSAVPLYGGAGNRAGYYQIESAQVEPVHAGGRDIWEYTLSLTSAGTRKSQFQALETSPSQPSPGHPFGNETDALVGVPAAARLVRAVDSTSSPTQRVQPTPVETISTEFGDVDLYDATALSIDDPVFIYDVEKDAQPAVDVRVYDTRGRDSKFIESDSGRVRAWQSVFARDHEFTGSVVFENGLLRLTIDEPTNADATASLDVEAYDAGADSWSAVDLPAYPGTLDTDWQPVDVDLVHIGQASVRAQVEFEAVAGVEEGDVYALDVELERGRSEVGVWIPESVREAIPADLQTMIDPIAATSTVDSGVEQGLVAREEVRL